MFTRTAALPKINECCAAGIRYGKLLECITDFFEIMEVAGLDHPNTSLYIFYIAHTTNEIYLLASGLPTHAYNILIHLENTHKIPSL